MKRLVPGLLLAGTVASVFVSAQQGVTPYKVGTFERQGNQFVGIVLRDSVVIDFSLAHAALAGAKVAAPTDMKDLIARYESGVRDRIVEIIKSIDAPGGTRPAYVYDLKTVKILPPIMYPMTMLNVAVNYREHAVEMAVRDAGGKPPASSGPAPGAALPGTKSAPGIWERKTDDTRWNPYMFIKLPSAIIAEGEAIRLPPGRTQIDWECELGVVIGRRASQVPIARAQDHIFGYTLENDVSDRAGRGDTRHGSDWLIAKNHDTFAPMGPFIVPKEFVPNVQKLAVRFTLNGQLMQDANTSLMIHDVLEQVSYASHIATLRPGDVIATGSPAGVGSARQPPIFLKAGDTSVCTYEGIGTLTNPVAGPAASTASR
ncbi:MAG TPA: fumarylacetoacetate hydrolase family protein [Vicinamibacterales bacterium]|jgi:2-keto-4-pentenoate hydratase/2-oxohepta-3-ene-1,7-dioic acid hydratase in catechol pathway